VRNPISFPAAKQMGAVVITGAASGIGAAITEQLTGLDVRVFGLDLNRPPERRGVTAVACDVTDQPSISRAVGLVTEAGVPIRGLVNCAGVVGGGPLVECTDEEILQTIDVNAMGMLRVIRALFHVLLRSSGMIVNVTSLSGLFPFPFAGPYVMSKHAAESMSVSLRRELAPLGIQVATILPGKVRTPFAERASELVQRKISGTSPYFRDRAARYAAYDSARFERDSVDPERVAAAALHALYSRRPRPRYFVVSHPLKTRLLLSLPQRLTDRIMARI